jgi:hypothetical protein
MQNSNTDIMDFSLNTESLVLHNIWGKHTAASNSELAVCVCVCVNVCVCVCECFGNMFTFAALINLSFDTRRANIGGTKKGTVKQFFEPKKIQNQFLFQIGWIL